MSTKFPPPPSPLDDPSVSDPLECPPLRWGLISCGRASHDFTQALKHLPTQTIVACSARSAENANEFAMKHSIEKSYGSYDDMLQDPDIDVVYVGNVHSFRRETGEKCLLANKHVLIEKPFACSVAEGEYLIGLATERNLFLLEGMWTRFFPAVQHARNLVHGTEKEKPILGEVAIVNSDFNFNGADILEEYPTAFLYNRKIGGGSSLLVAPYPCAAATLFYGAREPESVKVVGQVDKLTGVDLQASMLISFPPTSSVQPALDDENDEMTPKLPGTGISNLSFGMLVEGEEVTTAVGTKGRLTLETPGHCPTKLTVRMKDFGRGNNLGSVTYEYPLPEDTEDIIKAGGYFYPNSAGFVYEAAAVARCISAGKTEAPQFTHNETMLNLKLIEEIRLQLGLSEVDGPN